MKKLIDRIFNLIYSMTPLGLKLRYLQKIMEDKDRWPVYDQLKIPGFGTNLARFLFPIYSSNTPSYIDSISIENKNVVTSYFEKFDHLFEAYLDLVKERAQAISATYPLNHNEGLLPPVNNEFFGVLDAAVLQSMLKKHRPKNYIEIGSGISTKYARALISEENLETKIISIDPMPRVEIKNLCDKLIRKPLESCYAELLQIVKEGDIVFMDGSHYVFPNNDTVIFSSRF